MSSKNTEGTAAADSAPQYENPDKKSEDAQMYVGPANANLYDPEKAGIHRPEEHGDILVDGPGELRWRTGENWVASD
jgi:hypothetical protein